MSGDAGATPAAGARPRVDLSRFDNSGFDRGASRLKEAAWLVARKVLFEAVPFPIYRTRRAVLRLFGARIGRGVVIKEGVRVTFPWRLTVGDHAWLGEQALIHNLTDVEIGPHAVVSQRAFLCTGSHDWSAPEFDLITAPIRLQRGAWVAASAWVGPGVTVGEQAVLAAGSVATRDLAPDQVHRGNPAEAIRERGLEPAPACGGDRRSGA